MEDFKQKWAIVAFFDEVDDGYKFYYSATPMHLTFAGVFAIELNGPQIVRELESIATNYKPFDIIATEDAKFGPSGDIAVTKIEKSPELMDLYNAIHTRLVELGAIYNSPEYQGEGYMPHSTHQSSGRLTSGEAKRIDSVSLIDLFPDKDRYQRKVTATIRLG